MFGALTLTAQHLQEAEQKCYDYFPKNIVRKAYLKEQHLGSEGFTHQRPY